MSQKIIPHLWFDKEAVEAVEFYTTLFPTSTVTHTTTIHDTPSGDCDIVSFELAGQAFMAISAGPLFKFNPAISFQAKYKTKKEVDVIWEQLSPGGKVLMELGAYPFSERFGWLEDKYGVSWQIMYVGDQPFTQIITPMFLFVGSVCGQAEEAVAFYTSVFHQASTDFVMKYETGEEPNKVGTIKYADFTLEGQKFVAMDSAHEHAFSFNEAISFIIRCDDQEQIDYYWKKLSAVPEAEQCGWLKDKFGVSWQVVPTAMDEMMQTSDTQQLDRVTKAFLQMKKFDIAALQRAAKG